MRILFGTYPLLRVSGLPSMTNCFGLSILNQFVCHSIPKSKTLYFKTVIPSVLYGIVVWGSGSKFKELELIHIRAARLIHKLPKGMTDKDILQQEWGGCLLNIFINFLF